VGASSGGGPAAAAARVGGDAVIIEILDVLFNLSKIAVACLNIVAAAILGWLLIANADKIACVAQSLASALLAACGCA
jgi:hypothetical protein